MKTSLKNEFACFQTLWRLFGSTQFVKWRWQIWSWILKGFTHVKIEKGKFVVICPRSPYNVALGGFTSQSCSGRKRNVLKQEAKKRDTCTAGSRAPWDKGGRSSRPLGKGGRGSLPKNFISVPRASGWSINKGGGRGVPWIGHWRCCFDHKINCFLTLLLSSSS